MMQWGDGRWHILVEKTALPAGLGFRWRSSKGGWFCRLVVFFSVPCTHMAEIHLCSQSSWVTLQHQNLLGWDGAQAGKRVGVGRESTAGGIAACALGRSAEPGLRGSCRQSPHVTV